MSIQPLFVSPFFAPSQQLQRAFQDGSGAERPSSVSIDSGPNLGNIFDGRGNDFLDPDSIQGTVDDFSGSVSSSVDDTLLAQLLRQNVNPTGKNPDSRNILNNTLAGIQLIKDPNIGAGLLPRANSNPLGWVNPTALDIMLGTTFSGGAVVNNNFLFPNFPGFPSNLPGNGSGATPFPGAGGLPTPGTNPPGNIPTQWPPSTSYPFIPSYPLPSYPMSAAHSALYPAPGSMTSVFGSMQSVSFFSANTHTHNPFTLAQTSSPTYSNPAVGTPYTSSPYAYSQGFPGYGNIWSQPSQMTISMSIPMPYLSTYPGIPIMSGGYAIASH